MNEDVYALEIFIARFLRYGVLLAGFLMAFGWLSEINFTTDVFVQFQTYTESRLVPTLQLLVQQQRWGRLISYAGLGVLISLPVLRVLMTMIVFLRNRDYALALASSLVLAGLFLSVFLGFEI